MGFNLAFEGLKSIINEDIPLLGEYLPMYGRMVMSSCLEST
jgi:hypothetical protein